MTDARPVILRQARKRAAREADRRAAEANALHHGLSRAQRTEAEAEAVRARVHLDGHRREE